MAANLATRGFSVTGYSRTLSKVERLAAKGIIPAASLEELGKSSDAIMLSVSDGAAVRDVLFGPQALTAALKPGTLIIDTSTISPAETIDIAARCSALGLDFVDAPVTGGDIGARNATLTVMVGASHSAFARAVPLLEAIGKKIAHMGEVGSGQKTKAVNQVCVALSVVAMTEGLRFAELNGLDLAKTLDVISSGAAGSWSLSNYAPRILKNDLAPGFSAEHMLKDLRIAISELPKGMVLPGLEQAKELFEQLTELGPATFGNHALIEVYRKT